MLKKTLALGVTAILILCAANVVSEDSDATVTERVLSDIYVSEIVYSPHQNWSCNGLLFIENSEQHLMMKKFIEDPFHAAIPEKDDSGKIGSLSDGTKLYIYSSNGIPSYSYYDGHEYTYSYPSYKKVLDRHDISFFVREGDKFSLDLIDVKDYSRYSGNSVMLMFGAFQEQHEEGSLIEKTFNTNTVVTMSSNYSSIAADVTYEASGYSLPNGSSTAFMVAAFVIAATILAILVMCSIRPRWAR